MLKALTLYQPWASAVAFGFKRFETRGRSTSYRGRLLIHAAKRPWDPELLGVGPAWVEWATAQFRPFGITDLGQLPRGAALAVCNLSDVTRTENVVAGDNQRCWGDFTRGRYAYALMAVHAFEAIPCGGARGFWPVKGALLEAVEQSLQCPF